MKNETPEFKAKAIRNIFLENCSLEYNAVDNIMADGVNVTKVINKIIQLDQESCPICLGDEKNMPCQVCDNMGFVSKENSILQSDFCKIYSAYYGEPIDNIKQIVQHNFTGEELFEYVNYILKHHNQTKQ